MKEHKNKKKEKIDFFPPFNYKILRRLFLLNLKFNQLINPIWLVRLKKVLISLHILKTR